MAYPERLLGPDETIITMFKPHWHMVLVPLVVGFLALIFSGLAAAVLTGPVSWLLPLGLLIVWLALSVRRVADWWTTQYVITDERVVYRAGVFAREGKEIPLEVINDVAFNQSLFERMIGSGDLLIESAGEHGQSEYHNIPDPEGLQSVIYQVREDRMMKLRYGSSPTESVASQLSDLADLRERGVLSDEEFEVQKRKLLERDES